MSFRLLSASFVRLAGETDHDPNVTRSAIKCSKNDPQTKKIEQFFSVLFNVDIYVRTFTVFFQVLCSVNADCGSKVCSFG